MYPHCFYYLFCLSNMQCSAIFSLSFSPVLPKDSSLSHGLDVAVLKSLFCKALK